MKSLAQGVAWAQSHPATISLAPQPHSTGPWPGSWRGTVERHQVAVPRSEREPIGTTSSLEISENKGTCTEVFGSQGLCDVCVESMWDSSNKGPGSIAG